MYLGFLTGCLGAMPLKEKAKWASENGFVSLEISCWPNINSRDYSSCDIDVEVLTQEGANEIKAYFKEFGLVISSLAYYDNNLHNNPQTREKINNHVMKCIDAAVMLGVPAVGTFVGRNIDKSMSENFDEFEIVFNNLVAYAEKNSVLLMIENCPMQGWQVNGIPGTISFTPELWEEMFKRVPSKSFGLNFDPSHLVFQLIDYLPLISKFKDRIFHVHAKDCEVFEDRLKYYGIFNSQLETSRPQGYWRYRLPGMGQIDWTRLGKELARIGYEGSISIEHEDPDYEGSEELVKEGLVLGNRHLAAALCI